jgi:hypothetical protein
MRYDQNMIDGFIDAVNAESQSSQLHRAIFRLNPERTKRMMELRKQFAKIPVPQPAPIFTWSLKQL